MPARALVIGIEHYPRSVDLAATITGATVSAERFFNWLVSAKHLSAADVYVCAEGGAFAGATRFGTERESMVDAIAALVAAGQDQTDELFVFFSGHGYGYQESLAKHAVDILVASDFESADRSGTKCLNLQEVQEKLYAILGGQHHYYFVDACRTLIRDDEIDPIALGRRLGRPAQRGRPTKYTLYSTAYGTPAAINSGFAPALLDGLNGKGRAKGFTPAGSLYVMFPLLCSYVQARVEQQKMDQNKDGNGEGCIVEVVPVPTYTCHITIEGASATDAFEAKISVAGNPAFANVRTFTGSTLALPFNPGNLVLDVSRGGVPLPRVDPPSSAMIDFFDDCRVVFGSGAGVAPGPPSRDRSAAPMPPAAPPAPRAAPRLSLGSGRDLSARATNMQTGETRQIDSNTTADLSPGDYQITLEERGIPISRTLTTLEPGAMQRIGEEPLDTLRANIVRAVQGDPSRGVVAFSESLGDIANRDLGLWLTLMGASHILRDPTTFSKLQALPLDDVSVVSKDSTAVYVLGAVEDDQVTPRISVGRGPNVARSVAGLPGVFQGTVLTLPGSQLVTLGLGRAEPRTFASFCLPNRLTFIVFSPGSRGQLRVSQFLLPMYHMQAVLPAVPEDRVRHDLYPLRIMRTAYLFQSQLAGKRDVTPAMPEDQGLWDELLAGTWTDPVMSLVACYEILRRGDDRRRATLRDRVIPNLEREYPGIPDTAAVAVLLGLARPEPLDPCLVREGLLAFPDAEDRLPLPANRVDYNHLWTAWRGEQG